MRRIILIGMWFGSCLWGMAQTRESVTQVGVASGSAEWNNGQDSAFLVFNIGGIVNTSSVPVGPLEERVSAGFPYPVRYFSNVFAQNFFISKGYFPDVIQLQWDIESNADRIERFLIYRKPLGSTADSTLIASISSDDFSFSDETIQQGTLYKYTVFAKGILDEFRIPLINVIEGTGFAFPVGNASGRITFAGGTAVEGVTVIAETDGNLRGQSVFFDGQDDFLRVIQGAKDSELYLNEGFSLQLWTDFEGTDGEESVLFSKGDSYRLSYDGEEVKFKVHNDELVLPFVNPVDSFFHISAVFDPQSEELNLYAFVNDNRQSNISGSINSFPEQTEQNLLFARDLNGNFYHGYLEEIRLWNNILTDEDIQSNYSRFISGQEEGLAGYWKLDAGVGEDFYDFAQPNPGDFTENHGQVFGATFSDETPLNSQLAFRGITDSNGNYIITGFPFESSGSLYRFTPTLGVHAFEPTERIRFVGPSEAIHNEMDFNDVSSFPVSGTVFYRNMPFPLEDAVILVDGNVALDANGGFVATNDLGQFTVDVPIGLHSITVTKQDHTFDQGGRFPNDPNELFNFQAPLSGLVFQDTTLIRFSGRAAGGPVEASRPLGFGLSNNNIGPSVIVLRPEKPFSTTFTEFPFDGVSGKSDSLISISEDHFQTEVSFNLDEIRIFPDKNTGEFNALLPPERYTVADVFTFRDDDVSDLHYDFDETFNLTLDFRTIQFEEEILPDTTINEVMIEADTFRFNHRQDFILRFSPSIDVTQRGSSFFGSETLLYTDRVTGDAQEVVLFEEPDNYFFGHPIFKQLTPYNLEITVFEEFDDGAGKIDAVPVTDGYIQIQNNLASVKDTVLTLNDEGQSRYTFTAGFPNGNLDNVNGENSFTKTLGVTAFTGNEGSIQTVWRESDVFRGIIIGGQSIGNNFSTTGPTSVKTILRDPPGSGSSAFITKGNSITTSESFSETGVNTFSLNTVHHFGQSLTTVKGFVGIGAFAGTIDETESTTDLEVGITSETAWVNDSTMATTTTWEETISTSDAPELVGRDGDIFVGYSTNLVYGKTLDVSLVRSTDCLTCGDIENGGFRIGLSEGISIDNQINTFFALSQFTIENITIPSLEDLRNSILIYDENPDGLVVTEPTYVSLVPRDDERFGTDNNDEVWGTESNTDVGVGPSYKILFPDGTEPFNDTILYFNSQISEWEFWLAHNEQVKLQSREDLQNVTFDGGVTVERSVENATSVETSRTFEYQILGNVSTGFSFGTSFFGAKSGMDIEISNEGGGGNGKVSGNVTDEFTTYGYVLNDGDVGDTYTVDVAKANDGFGPVFRTRGGATSCPYEGEVLTRYFEPGATLSVATAQHEVPHITVDNPIVSNVPANRPAVFTIQLQNNSETGEGAIYDLDLVDGTNPFGAIISIDGTPLGNGLSFLVEAGETLTKTLTLRPSTDDVLNYEDIGIEFASQCQADPTDNLDDIASEISISAFFEPGCSDVRLQAPLNQWVLNTRAIQEDILPIRIDSYDLNFSNFRRIDFQYKSSSSSTWITNRRFYNPLTVSQEDFDAINEDIKEFIDGGTITYSFDVSSLPDREYDIRAVSVCELGPGSEVTTPTDIASGIKDTQRPRVFGAPQPADGILSAGDEISLRFSEPIEEGLLTPNNFSIRGVLNNTPITNNTSVKFDGVNDYMRIDDGLTLANDFTIFFWLRREVFGEDYVIFSKGTGINNNLEIGFNAANQFQVNVSGQVIESSLTFPTTGNSDWEYYAVSYDAEENELFAYRNGAFVLERVALTEPFTGEGSIAVGKSVVGNNLFFEGNVHELRVWNTYRQLTDVIAGQSVSLSGSELGLTGYWPMNEGRGELAIDKARSRNGLLFADWQIDPQGYSSQFDGLDDFLEISTASTVTIEDDQDFTIEFWFNAKSGQTETVFFSSGKADGTDVFSDPENSWNIGIGTNGDLFVLHNGTNLPLEGTSSFVDDNWHHFALSLNRTGNLNVFLDEQQQASVSPDNYGGLTGTEMWIGARGYKVGTISSSQDQFFAGWIDEFRIWNTTRRLNQLSVNLNIAQESDEVGLVAYYPFEFFEIQAGVPLRTSSLEDLTEESAGLATAFGGADFSMNTANIRVANPISSIDFDWVVNDDEIIFSLNESFSSLIEQTIVTISARAIEDKLQNRLASPVSWTAFIDRNQVKWDVSEIEISKQVYEAATFKVNVLNLGGTEESFEITNLPPWLTASPASGTLAPNSVTAVEFSVNSGLNTGYYQEDIFLTSDFGFDEKLSLDLSVFSPAPDWTLDARDFQYSMNMVGQVEIDGIISRDENDLVAAFVEGEIRGMVHVDYIREIDSYLAYLTIYSNVAAGESVELRVWDASQGIEYRGNVAPNITFQSNELLGNDTSPITIQVGNTLVQEVVLEVGWNWVSFAIDNSNFNNLDLILQDLPAEAGYQIKSQQHADIYTPGIGWRGSLTNAGGFQSGEMYRFFVGDTDLEVVGLPIVVRQRSINLEEGWNWLGFTPRFNQTVNEALAGLQNVANGDVIKSQFLFAVYRENIGWIGTLEFMEPGKGYLIRKANADTFTYPETTGLSRNENYWNLEVKQTRKYESNMTLLSSVSGLFDDGEYELQIVDEEGDFRGAIQSTFIDGRPYYFLNVQGTSLEQLRVFAQDLQTGAIYESKTTLVFDSDQHLGSLDKPLVFDFESSESSKLTDVKMYPNPFEDRLSIQFPGVKTNVPVVHVANLSGKMVRELRLEFEGKEQWVTEWDGRLESGTRVNPGIYLLVIQISDKVSSYKISLK